MNSQELNVSPSLPILLIKWISITNACTITTHNMYTGLVAAWKRLTLQQTNYNGSLGVRYYCHWLFEADLHTLLAYDCAVYT